MTTPYLRNVPTRSWKGERSSYDASYVALAEFLDGPLLTADALHTRAPGTRRPVTVVPNRLLGSRLLAAWRVHEHGDTEQAYRGADEVVAVGSVAVREHARSSEPLQRCDLNCIGSPK